MGVKVGQLRPISSASSQPHKQSAHKVLFNRLNEAESSFLQFSKSHVRHDFQTRGRE
jgi:hypothetical protein